MDTTKGSTFSVTHVKGSMPRDIEDDQQLNKSCLALAGLTPDWPWVPLRYCLKINIYMI
jgi:hypothetical protein